MLRSATALTSPSVAALVAMALYASMAAPAGAWLVAGSELTSTAALASTASVSEHFTLKSAGVTVECDSSTLNATSAEITAADGLNASQLTFNECSANENCTVTKSIGTAPIEVQFIEHTLQEDKTLLVPKTKTTLATIKYEGAECALSGTQPMTGQVSANFPKGQEEKTLQEIKTNASTASGELKLASNAAEFKGAALLKLQTGQAVATRLPTLIPSLTRWNAGRTMPGNIVTREFEYTNEGPGVWTPGDTSWQVVTEPSGLSGVIIFSVEVRAEPDWCRPNVGIAVLAKCKATLKFKPATKTFYRGLTGILPGADGVNVEGEGE